MEEVQGRTKGIAAIVKMGEGFLLFLSIMALFPFLNLQRCC